MSRNDYRSEYRDLQQQELIQHLSNPFGLGLSELEHAEELRRVRSAFTRGTFGRFGTIEEWIDETVHPAWRDEAVELVAKLRSKLTATSDGSPSGA